MFEVCCTYTPEALENHVAVHLAFLDQAAQYIKRKVQQLSEYEGEKLSELIAIDTKVYQIREASKKMKTWGLVKVLLAVKSQGPDGFSECW